MGQLYKVLKIDIFESCSWLGPLGVLIHQKKIFDPGCAYLGDTGYQSEPK